MGELPETKVDQAGGQTAGEPAKPVPGSTQEPPPADPSDPNSPPASTGVDSQVETPPVEMPKSEFEGGTNVVGISAGAKSAPANPAPAPAPKSAPKK